MNCSFTHPLDTIIPVTSLLLAAIPGAVAKWGHHTWRRTSDKMAQATAKITGATTLMIDELYGWRQAEHAKRCNSSPTPA